jgi:hypothetical protein
MATTTSEALADRRVASTVQRVLVDAPPADVYTAIWEADLLRMPLARCFSSMSLWPERIRAWARREPPPPRTARSARLRDMLGDGSPWILVADEPRRDVVLGLLWTPPAGGTTCAPGEFARFTAPGVAKVTWSLSVAPFGAGHTLLTTTTSTETCDATAARRFRLIWPLIGPFASILRMQVLRAIKAHAEIR